MTINPRDHDYSTIYKLMIGSIVPRPIGFISSISGDGVCNLAPFSFFNGVCSNPPIVLFSTVVKKNGQHKDTLMNVEATGEFVVNIVSEDFAEQMNVTSADYPPGVDEFMEFVLRGLRLPGGLSHCPTSSAQSGRTAGASTSAPTVAARPAGPRLKWLRCGSRVSALV